MKKNLFIALLVFAYVLCACPSFAQEENLPLVVKGQYFSLYGPVDIDISELLAKLNFNYFLHIGNLLDKANRNPKDILMKTLDALYLEACDILGIHVYSFHGNINLYPDHASLNKVFRSYFEKDFPERSFYLHKTNTIYISLPDLTLGMIGHEMSHAIMSHYFVIPPPAKVQEILSGYVEYSLRKSTGTLP